MKHEFVNIFALYQAIENGFNADDYEGSFVDIKEWNKDPSNTSIYFFDEDDIYDDEDVDYEEIENDNEDLPRIVVKMGLDSFLVGPNIVDIFEVMKRQGKKIALDSIVRSINYYREYDSFEP